MVRTASKMTFVRSAENANTIRGDFVISMLPVMIWSLIRFGFHAFEIIAVTVISTIASDIAFKLIFFSKKPTVSLYAVYCGMFLSLSFYPSTSILIAGIGGIICALMLNMLGGEGKCLVFAPIAARLIAFELIPFRINKPDNMPFEKLLSGELPTESSFDFMLGTVDGALGTVSVIAISVGAVYLFIRKSADCRTAFSYIASAAVLYYIFPLIRDNGAETVLYEVISGDIIFAAVFALTNFSKTPKTIAGKHIKGIICAVLTFILRKTGFTADAVFIAILITDLASSVLSYIVIRSAYVKEAMHAE